MALSEIEKNRKEAAKWGCITPEDSARPATKIAIGVTKSGQWIWGDPDSPIIKRRKERSDKGKPRVRAKDGA